MTYYGRFKLSTHRKKSDKYLFYEALSKRLHSHHFYWETVQQNLRKESGGYAGELRVDRELSETEFFKDYRIMRNVFVGSKDSYCQIDTLVIYHTFILIIEVKNIPGVLTYDEITHQLTRRKDNGPVEGMGDPESQLKRSERLVKKFLDNKQITIPIHGMIVFANPASILERPFPQSHAIHVSGLYQAMDNLHAEHQKLPQFDTRKIHRLFEKHEPILPPYKPTHIPINMVTDVISGVLCPHCIRTKLQYKSKLWRCTVCHFKSGDAHLESLQDYLILFNEELGTSEWMKFVGLNSLATTKRMLSESNLEKIGGNKNRKWLIRRKVSKS